MRFISILMISALCVSVTVAFAADKNRILSQLDAARATIEKVSGKVEGNKEAAADLDRARAALKDADENFKSGKTMFGFGEISPETEREIKLAVDIAELATATALSRLEYITTTAELDAIEKQFTAVKSKLKLFEDRKAELERLRLEVAACQKTGKELEAIKTEKAALMTQLEQLAAEKSRADKLNIEQLELVRKLEEIKTENARLSALAATLEKQLSEKKVPNK